jgi:hypothetical protein
VSAPVWAPVTDSVGGGGVTTFVYQLIPPLLTSQARLLRDGTGLRQVAMLRHVVLDLTTGKGLASKRNINYNINNNKKSDDSKKVFCPQKKGLLF